MLMLAGGEFMFQRAPKSSECLFPRPIGFRNIVPEERLPCVFVKHYPGTGRYRFRPLPHDQAAFAHGTGRYHSKSILERRS
jgi:hypothetical protein